MDKATFCWILECSLLSWDGVLEQEMISLGADPTDAKSGIKLCEYLKSIKLTQELTQ